MHWLDGLGGLLVMLAAMAAIVLFALPTFEGQRAFWYGALVLPFAAVGGGLVWYGRYWYIPALPSRKHPRTTCRIAAEIVSDEQAPIQCRVIEISDGGAALSLPVGSNSGMPQNFELLIKGHPQIHRCRVVWMQRDTFGVEFQKTTR